MRIPALTLAACLGAAPALADFTISFDWGDIPICTTGRPGKVASPTFTVRGLPEGTTLLVFKLTDLDVPGYNHGGGKVDVSGDGTIASGAFRYKSPCPPNGVHTYEWRATAKMGNQTVGIARARRDYPQ